MERTLEPCKTALKDSGFSAAEINEVVLVGGMTRMPKIIETVKNFFSKEPNKSVNPDEVVAIGAAIGWSATRRREGCFIVGCDSFIFGIETWWSIYKTNR